CRTDRRAEDRRRALHRTVANRRIRCRPSTAGPSQAGYAPVSWSVAAFCYPEAYHEQPPRDDGPDSFSTPSPTPMHRPTPMDRRDFLKLAGAAAAAGPLAAQQTQMPMRMPGPMTPVASGAKEISGTVFNLEIAPVTVELA